MTLAPSAAALLTEPMALPPTLATPLAEAISEPLAEWRFAAGWLIVLAGSITALVTAWRLSRWVGEQDAGLPRMQEIAGYVRDGADAYLKRQYQLVAIFFAVVFAILLTLSLVLKVQSAWVPFAFLSGGFLSALAGWCGMRTATMASSRTAQACRSSLNDGLQVAFRSGAVMGLTVVGLALLDISVWSAVLHWLGGLSVDRVATTMLCFGMGASCQALFARVGGGIFTKAADVGADLVGKTELAIPEDDPRNPATIADNVGDNVGDVAGMGADLYESYSGSILASAALGVSAYAGAPAMQARLMLLPMVLAALGVGVSTLCMKLVQAREGATQRQLLHALGRAINVASAAMAAVALLLVWLMLVWPSAMMADELAALGLRSGVQMYGVFAAIFAGLAAGVGIGRWTEYSTSDVYAPTKRIADQTATGPATVIIAGMAEGMSSVWVPVLVISAAILLAFGACTGFDYADPASFGFGLYGVAIAAVGMLSTLGLTLATDAYGPIADNAGGNAEMSELDPEVRERTDALDSLGNTTAATGKGFAIGSAALTALALLAAYMLEVRNGFDRWAASPDQETRQRITWLEDEIPVAGFTSVYKLRDDVFATPGGGSRPKEMLLLSPDAVARVGRLQRAERAPDTGSAFVPGLSDVDRSLAELIALPVGEPASVSEAALSSGAFVPASAATLPDLVRHFNLSLLNPKVLVGLLLGVMLACLFCAQTMKAVGRAAGDMVVEVRRQFDEIPGLIDGEGQPDYESCVRISTKSAQREMIAPALLALAAPVTVGLLLGVAGVVGMLSGALSSGFAIAILMANAGGAWDNAKKMIEAGAHGGKGTEAHKAAVVGDTVGDPFKDTSGPSLNILIKLMSMVSVVFAGLVVRYGL